MAEKAVGSDHPQQLPPAVQRASAAAALGDYEKTWRPPAFTWMSALGLLLVVVMIGLTNALILEAASDGSWWQVGPEALLLGPIGFVTWRIGDPLRPRLRVYGFEGGIIYRSRRCQLTAIPWDAITGNRRSQRDARGIMAYTRTVAIRLRDGRAVSIDDFDFSRTSLDEIMTTVDRRLTEVRLPELEDRIADGEEVVFGRIRLNATGITSPGLTVTWPDVQNVADDFSGVRIRTAGRWQQLLWARSDGFSDVYLLVALAKRLARRQP